MNDTGISICLRYEHWCTIVDTCEGALAELKSFAKGSKGGFASRAAVAAADDKLSLILEEFTNHLGEFRSDEASDEHALWAAGKEDVAAASGSPVNGRFTRKPPLDEV